jgi:hypothetical protein
MVPRTKGCEFFASDGSMHILKYTPRLLCYSLFSRCLLELLSKFESGLAVSGLC